MLNFDQKFRIEVIDTEIEVGLYIELLYQTSLCSYPADNFNGVNDEFIDSKPFEARTKLSINCHSHYG